MICRRGNSRTGDERDSFQGACQRVKGSLVELVVHLAETQISTADLIGLRVVNREGEALGTVAGLIDTGPHSVLRVAPEEPPAAVEPHEAERLIPFVGAYIDAVSIEQKLITVDWGLDY